MSCDKLPLLSGVELELPRLKMAEKSACRGIGKVSSPTPYSPTTVFDFPDVDSPVGTPPCSKSRPSFSSKAPALWKSEVIWKAEVKLAQAAAAPPPPPSPPSLVDVEEPEEEEVPEDFVGYHTGEDSIKRKFFVLKKPLSFKRSSSTRAGFCIPNQSQSQNQNQNPSLSHSQSHSRSQSQSQEPPAVPTLPAPLAIVPVLTPSQECQQPATEQERKDEADQLSSDLQLLAELFPSTEVAKEAPEVYGTKEASCLSPRGRDCELRGGRCRRFSRQFSRQYSWCRREAQAATNSAWVDDARLRVMRAALSVLEAQQRADALRTEAGFQGPSPAAAAAAAGAAAGGSSGSFKKEAAGTAAAATAATKAAAELRGRRAALIGFLKRMLSIIVPAKLSSKCDIAYGKAQSAVRSLTHHTKKATLSLKWSGRQHSI
eukprot:jgi/Mesen1/9900/ME000070S09184